MGLDKFLKFWKTIQEYRNTIIWCGWCGEYHKFGFADEVVCSVTGQNLLSIKAWRVNGNTIGCNERHDIFIAWDNLAKWNGTYEHKLEIEQEVWKVMSDNAYFKHKNGQEKIKGCSECQKHDTRIKEIEEKNDPNVPQPTEKRSVHKQEIEELYLKAGWRK